MKGCKLMPNRLESESTYPMLGGVLGGHREVEGATIKCVIMHNDICDQVCDNMSYLHIQFYDFEDT